MKALQEKAGTAFLISLVKEDKEKGNVWNRFRASLLSQALSHEKNSNGAPLRKRHVISHFTSLWISFSFFLSIVLLLFSCYIVSDSLWPNRLQHTRVSCPSLSPGVCANSCALSQWCYATISSCGPLLLLPSVFPSIRAFSNELALGIRWPEYWSLSISVVLVCVWRAADLRSMVVLPANS